MLAISIMTFFTSGYTTIYDAILIFNVDVQLFAATSV